MRYGLLTRRSDGTSIITPDTFTVRVVDVFHVALSKSWGSTYAKAATPDQTIARPKVREGMFATCTPSQPHTITKSLPGQILGWAISHLDNQGAQIPKVTCINGAVVLSKPISGGKYGGEFYIHIYEYL